MIKGQSHVTASLSASVALSAADAPAMVDQADGSAIQRVRLIPMGSFTTRGKGKFFVQDMAHAKSIVALSQQYAGSDDISVDFDHQTVFAAVPGVGGKAEASGWIAPASLSAEADGIYGDVHWTAQATRLIKARKYRYLSPYIAHETTTGRVNALLNAGLTNTPAIVGLTKLAANASLNPQEPIMDLTALAASLNLPATATLEECLAAQQAQAAALSAVQAENTALRAAAGVVAGADSATALSAVTALRAGATDQTALMTQMQQQLTALTSTNNTAEVDANIAAGRVIPAQRDHFVALMASNPALARTLMSTNPVVVAQGELLGGRAAGEVVTALSADQKAAADMLGVDHAAYLKTLQENAQ